MPEMWRFALVASLSLLLASPVLAAGPGYKFLYNATTDELDYVVDTQNLGDVTGLTVAMTDLDCSIYGNGGKLTTDASGNFICAADTGTGSAANSFETLAVPAGASVVADSATDTLTITETSFLTLTGTAATDTIDITQVTTDLGTDGLIAANAVALGTDTTNAYVADLTAGTYIDVSGGGAETANVTVTVDTTEINSTTFGDGTNVENTLTFGVTSTDPQLFISSGTFSFSTDIDVGGDSPSITLSPTVGAGLHLGVDPNSSVAFLSSTNNDVRYLVMSGVTKQLTLGDQGAALTSLNVFTDGTGNSEVNLPTDSIGVDELDTANTPTDGQFPAYTASSGRMTWTTASGSGDITDVYNCASGDCATITMGASDTLVASDGSLINLSAASVSSTTEGLILPQHATDCSTAGTAEGQVCWEADANALYVGNGATVTQIGSGSDTNADKEFLFPASSLEPLEAADSIPPLTKTTGTNVDEFSISYDATTDEGRKVSLVVPGDVQSGSTITFKIYWWSVTATTNAAVWNVRYQSTGADGETWDAALTTLTATCTVAGTVKLLDVCTITETLANLGWAAGDAISLGIYRDADNASDTLVGDAELKEVVVIVPRA